MGREHGFAVGHDVGLDAAVVGGTSAAEGGEIGKTYDSEAAGDGVADRANSHAVFGIGPVDNSAEAFDRTVDEVFAVGDRMEPFRLIGIPGTGVAIMIPLHPLGGGDSAEPGLYGVDK